MIIVDTALANLEKNNTPIRVGMIGAGFMATGSALTMIKYTEGMRLLAIANRNVSKAREAFEKAGKPETVEVNMQSGFEDNVGEKSVITRDYKLLCHSPHIDVILEMTGDVEFGAATALEAIRYGKHFVSFNAELFGTLGSILKKYADDKGVIFTLADGDQPVVQMNLYRFVKSLGIRPVLCGNIKGLHDPYRTPSTQAEFAKKWKQNPIMVTSFADGSKISFEQAVVANATGMGILKRGMMGPTVGPNTSIEKSVDLYPVNEVLMGNGVVDYVVGAVPGPGVFVLGTIDDSTQQHYLNLYKLGQGPLYCFYTPYHLCHFEAPTTIARAFIFKDAALAPIGKPFVDVICAAKHDLKAGQKLDGIGEYDTYGLCENYDTARMENLLPIGLVQGCILKRDIPKDQALTFDDVVLPKGRLSDKLWNEQVELYN